MSSLPKQLYSSAQNYLLLALAGVLAYLPVSSMTFALKNDIITLEYPIKYFISQCLHNGVQPFWFNTWALGFPLESILTWSAHSPLQLLFGFLFEYNLYALHIEFVFYIVLSGCTSFYFLKKHITPNRQLAWMIACCYMLSGFAVGSSQWLLYITASAFIPLIISLLFDLLKNPGWRTALLFSVAFYTMLTSVYVAFNIVTVYLIGAITLFYLIKKYFFAKQPIKQNLLFLSIASAMILLLCAPALVASLTLLQSIERGGPIASDNVFFNSNYLPPKGLLSMVIPLSSIRLRAFNTEGTMFHTYIGLLPLLLLPLSIAYQAKNRSLFSALVFAAALFFLLLSLGATTPLRTWMNLLPGFSYFRNPGLFRIFFIFFLLVFIARQIKDFDILYQNKKWLFASIALLSFFYILTVCVNSNSISHPNAISGLKAIVQSITLQQAVFISSSIQLALMLCITAFFKLKKIKLLSFFVVLDLIINTLLCIPYFTVSSYSVREVNTLLKSQPGFPLQKTFVADVAVKDTVSEAQFYHLNIYRKEIGAQEANWGPLLLKQFVPVTDTTKDISHFKHPILFIDSSLEKESVTLTIQQPNFVAAQIETQKPVRIHFLQNYYASWKAYHNKKQLEIRPVEKGGMEVTVLTSGLLEFRYEKKFLWCLVLIINTIVAFVTGYFLFHKLKRLIKSSSPS